MAKNHPTILSLTRSRVRRQNKKKLTISTVLVLCLVPTSANVYTLQLRVKGYRFEVLVPTFDTVYVLQLRGYRFEVRMPTSAPYTHCSCVLKDIDLS